MIEPTFVETLDPRVAHMRLTQLHAHYVPAKSRPTRQVYWAPAKNTWILISPHGRLLRLGYYVMEKCPCED